MRSLILLILFIIFFAIAAILSERAEDDELWAVIFILLFVLTIWLLVSTLVCLYWLYSPPDYFWEQHKRISKLIYVGAFFGSIAIIGGGIERFLWFIPESWVFEKQGDMQTARHAVAHFIGFFVSFFLFVVLEKPCIQKHREQTEKKIGWEVEDLMQMLVYSEDDSLLKELRLEELRLEKLNLEALDFEGKLTLIQQRRLLVLNRLFDVLNQEEEGNGFNNEQEN